MTECILCGGKADPTTEPALCRKCDGEIDELLADVAAELEAEREIREPPNLEEAEEW